MNTAQSKERGKEIVGTANFSGGRAFFRIIRGCIYFSLFVMTGIGALFAGEMLVSAFLFSGVLLIFPGLLDLLLSDRIIFYGNRVTKIWHILEPKTIYFSNAKVWRDKMSTAPAEWEITENGPGDWVWPWQMQRQILYEPRYFPSEASQEIESLLTDLAGDEISGRPYSKKAGLMAVIATVAIVSCLVLLMYFFRR
jgi:hypothetical protein